LLALPANQPSFALAAVIHGQRETDAQPAVFTRAGLDGLQADDASG
jgi:hypothetical protein